MPDTIQWQSNFGLMESEDSSEAWDLSVTAFVDGTVSVAIAQPGEDVYKEFMSVKTAYDWLVDFAGDQYLELNPLCDFEFRELLC